MEELQIEQPAFQIGEYFDFSTKIEYQEPDLEMRVEEPFFETPGKNIQVHAGHSSNQLNPSECQQHHPIFDEGSSDDLKTTQPSTTPSDMQINCSSRASALDSPKMYKAIRKLKNSKDLNFKRKKRLNGDDLISSLRNNPIFQNHEELFDNHLDDNTRKKMMQKIRNRISAQESRDRKKELLVRLRENNEHLLKENIKLKSRIEELEVQNQKLMNNMKNSVSTDDETRNSDRAENSQDSEFNSIQDIDELGELMRDTSSGGMGSNWKTFAIFMVGVIIYSTTLPEEQHAVSIKTGGIVPLFGKQLLPQKDKVRSLALAENICNKFCRQYDTMNMRRGLEVSRKVHAIADNIYLKGNNIQTRSDEVYLSQEDSSALAMTGREYPHDTIYCDSAVMLGKTDYVDVTDFDMDKKFIHIMIPNRRLQPRGGSLIKEEPNEYIGVYARVLDTRNIVVGQTQGPSSVNQGSAQLHRNCDGRPPYNLQ